MIDEGRKMKKINVLLATVLVLLMVVVSLPVRASAVEGDGKMCAYVEGTWYQISKNAANGGKNARVSIPSGADYIEIQRGIDHKNRANMPYGIVVGDQYYIAISEEYGNMLLSSVTGLEPWEGASYNSDTDRFTLPLDEIRKKGNVKIYGDTTSVTYILSITEVSPTLSVSGEYETVYAIGDEFDTTGIVVTKTLFGGSTQDVTAQTTFSGFDSSTSGQKTITATCDGLTTTFTVTVMEAGAHKMAVYVDGVDCKVTRKDSQNGQVTITADADCLIIKRGTDIFGHADWPRVITLNGFFFVTIDAENDSYQLEWNKERWPGASYDPETEQFTLPMDGIRKFYNEITINGGTADQGVPSWDLLVNGLEERPTVETISVSGDYRKEYAIGETFDATGLTVTATMSDGSTKDVTAQTIFRGFDSETAGEKTVTAAFYNDSPSTTFTVTVKDATPAIVYGDANNNGEVTAADASIVYAIANQVYTGEVTDELKTALDVDGDGKITAKDAALVYGYANKKITSFPVQTQG